MAKAPKSPADVLNERIRKICRAGAARTGMTDENARVLIKELGLAFKLHLEQAGFEDRAIKAIRTKFRDAGRRSAPWKPTSSRVPGRPQDGSDGNRINRWLLPEDHKFYATEVNATLVEAKYYFQAWSMSNAPVLPRSEIQECFHWLVGHDIQPGAYRDPIQLCPIDLLEFANNPRLVQSGHLNPLDRGGRHIYENTFLMLARSNQLQGNLTLDELVGLMRNIVEQHEIAHDTNPVPFASDKDPSGPISGD